MLEQQILLPTESPPLLLVPDLALSFIIIRLTADRTPCMVLITIVDSLNACENINIIRRHKS